MKKKWLALALCLIMVVAFAAACGGDDKPTDQGQQGGQQTEKPVVKVGFMGPITGSNAAEGSAARNAFQLAFDQLNASGQLPYTVQVVAMDDASKAETGASAARKLTSETGMIAISGHWNSPVAEATIPICKQAGIPLCIWGAIGPTLTSEANYPNTTRVAPTSLQENEPLIKNVYDMGYRNFYVISDATSYGTDNTATFKAELANYPDAKLVGVDEVQTGTNDFRPILSKLPAEVDAIYFGGVSQEAGLVKRQMGETKGMEKVLLFGISGIASDDFITAAGDAAEGTVSNKPGVDPNKTESGKKFIADYQAAGYKEPIGAFTPYAYDAAQVLIAAMKSVDGVPTAAQMVDAIRNAEAVGLLGTTTFNEIGQTTNPASYMVVVQDGKWMPYADSEYANGTRTLPKK